MHWRYTYRNIICLKLILPTDLAIYVALRIMVVVMIIPAATAEVAAIIVIVIKLSTSN